jgi:hypothetical protein
VRRSSTWAAPRTRVLWLLSAVAIVIAIAAASAAMAWQGSGEAEARDSAKIAEGTLGELATDRVKSIELDGSTVTVIGTATSPGAEATRTLWFETIAGAAFAQEAGATFLKRTVVDEEGNVLATETDPVDAEAVSVFATPPVRSAEDITREVQSRASALGANLTETNYLPLLGGTAELVVEPSDPTAFAEAAGSNVATLLGDLADNHGPYLVTIVDSQGAPLLVLGYTPGVGGGFGQGVGWQAPGIDSDAIFGQMDEADLLPYDSDR